MSEDQLEELMDAGIITEDITAYRTMRALEGIRFQLGRIADHLGGQTND